MSLMTMENTIKDIKPRKVKAGTPDERIIYDAVDKDGTEWTIWEKLVAEQAWALKDQPSVWKVDVAQNGKWTNRTLKEIQPALGNGMDQALGAVTSDDPFSPGFEGRSIAEQITFPSNEQADAPSLKDLYIWRQCATKVAATMSSTSLEFWANVDMLMGFYETGQKPRTHDDDIPF